MRAVRAGLAIRDRMHRLQQSLGLDEPLEVRVGVETGEAATGVGPTGQLLVTGQVVNAAARLQAAAKPGEVLVGATTHALTKDAVSFGPQQEVEAKGFAGALPAYQVEQLTTRSARRTIPFVGRSNEMDILRGSVARVNATASPLLVSILGEPGVGKSRLVDELLAGLERRRHRPPRAGADLRRHRHVRAGDGDRPRDRGHRGRHGAGGGEAPAAGRGGRLLRSERGGAGRRASRPHDRARRPQAARSRSSSRTCRAGSCRSSRVSGRAERSSSCSKTCTCSGRRCST